ncbi:hypothetical protein FQZ97_1031260 [compost metagenome]
MYPQVAELAIALAQGNGWIQRQAPGAVGRAFIENLRGAEFEVLHVVRVFDQVRRKRQALIGDVRLNGQLLVGGAVGEQRLELSAGIDQQVRRGRGRRLASACCRLFIQMLDKFQFGLGE